MSFRLDPRPESLQGGWLLRFIILLAAFSTLPGCGRIELRPEPPDYLVISGKGRAEPADFLTPTRLNSLNRLGVRFETSLPYDRSVEDPAIRASMARASLHRLALRNLGASILRLKDSHGIDISRSIYENGREADLIRMIESNAFREWNCDRNACHLAVSIPFKVLEDNLNIELNRVEDELGHFNEAEKDAFMKRSRDIAITQAKQLLRGELKKFELADGSILGELMDADPGLAGKIASKIWLLEPDEIEFADDLTCIVTLFFDRNPVLHELAQKQSGWFH